MNELEQELAKILGNCAYAENNNGNSNTVNVSISRQLPEPVEEIVVTLYGENTLTGEPVSKKRTIRGQAIVRFKNLIYDGNFSVNFCIKLKDGKILKNFIEDIPIRLDNPGMRPKIKKIAEKKKGEFTRLELEGNCWRALKGKLWLKYDGHYQILGLPENQPNRVVAWLPTNSKIEIFVPSGVYLA